MNAKRLVVVLASMAVLTAACGQFPNTHQAYQGGGYVVDQNGNVVDANGSPLPPGTTVDANGNVVPAENGGGTNGGGTNGGGTNGTPSPGSSSAPPPTGGDTTGVSANEIDIGIHAPITGAAPVTDTSFEVGKDLYFRYGGANLSEYKIFGRSVQVEVQDDQYTPSVAVQKCQTFAQQKFLVVGGAGTDQIVACARILNGLGVPYLSAGVNQQYVAGLHTYFSTSETYPQQMGLLASYIKNVLHMSCGNNVRLVATDTPNFDDAVNAFAAACPGVVVNPRPGKSESDATSTGQSLCNLTSPKYDLVVPLTAPLFFLEMIGPNGAGACRPQFAGIGITMGLDVVAERICGDGYASDSMHFFHPVGAFTDVATKDSQFMAAAQKKTSDPDDIMWILWNLDKGIAAMLEKAGQSLTREGFIYSTERGTFQAGGLPTLHYSPQSHFGATSVSVLKLHCEPSTGYWLTQYQNVSSF